MTLTSWLGLNSYDIKSLTYFFIVFPKIKFEFGFPFFVDTPVFKLRLSLTDIVILSNVSHRRAAETPYFTPALMITPVRRSVRLETRRSFLPDNLQEHDVCVNSLSDLPTDTLMTEFILRPNRALAEEFDEWYFVRIIYYIRPICSGSIPIMDWWLVLVLIV